MTPPTSMRRESPQPSGAAPPSDEPINTSDNESGGEKPVREKLRDTRIANQAMDEDTTSPGSSAGRLRRKRSLEDIQDDEDNDEELGKLGKHARKRSRSNTPEDKMDSVEDDTPQVVTNGSRVDRSLTPELSSGRADEAQPTGLASPKNKRTRDQVSKDEEGATTGSGDGSLATRSADKDNKLPGDDRQTKRHRDSGSPEPATVQGTTKISPSSGFANSSATSPFGALASNPAKADVPQTSESKFASSGFGKLASASASPFGAATANKGPSLFGAPASKSVFASSATSSFGAPKDATAPMQPSAFGASAGGSAFGSGTGASVFGSGSSTSVFGSTAKTGSLFGSPFAASKPGSSLGSFAGGSGPKIEGLSSKPAKAFGAAEDSDDEPDEDEDEEDDEGHKSPSHVTDEATAKKDKRFYEQEVETGEEGEKTLFSSRAKLYNYVKNEAGGQWKERGSGILKVNVPDVEDGENDEEEKEGEKEEEGNGKSKAKEVVQPLKAGKPRFIMRANGTNRVVLNSPVPKDTDFGHPGAHGAKPTGQTIMFMGMLDVGEMQTLQLKLNADSAKNLWDIVQQLREDM